MVIMRITSDEFNSMTRSGKFIPDDSFIPKKAVTEQTGTGPRRLDFLTLVLPWPPSANRIWRNVSGRTYVSREYKKFLDAVGAEVDEIKIKKRIRSINVNGKNVLMGGKFNVEIVLHPPNKRPFDVDNRIKPVLDALTKSGVWNDDADVDQVSAIRSSINKIGMAFVIIKTANV